MAGHDLSLIVPAFNEAGRIRGTLEALRSYLQARALSYEIIVAADGDDGTREIAAGLAAGDPRLSVLGGPERGGKGRGIRLGVARARGRMVAFVDADDKTPVEEMDKLLPWLDRGFDIVIGSRGMADSLVEVPQAAYRRVGSRAFGLVMHAILGLRNVRDTQCGFKLFRGAVAHDLFSRMRMNGFSFDVEVLLMAQRRGYRVAEIPVNWVHQPGSKVHLIKDSLRMARDLFRMRAAALRGEYDQPHVARLTPMESSRVPTQVAS